ncbi:hypothetical protein BSU04_39040 [Caballeronia sordidicola]|uniref:Uncharacterized protein n=1 Tax=Caballeronia sordidicola TaxID=196367 RepID=A0A226WP35_CABSO|nr:hypothetical protein BSU04_39040 [Caballeronia sordidicola]
MLRQAELEAGFHGKVLIIVESLPRARHLAGIDQKQVPPRGRHLRSAGGAGRRPPRCCKGQRTPCPRAHMRKCSPR